tara:strand:- start:2444 stop:3010 length:567 start_codon:yes stop_codon:yes gene_type:complete
MKGVVKRFFNDVILFEPNVFKDNRGYFYQSFDQEISDVIGNNFVQDNHSVSHKNVIRGLHYQWDNPMGKLVRVVKGSVVDCFVDIRDGSPTYGEYDCVELSEESHNMLWIPGGFAHGFASLEDNTTLLYRCDAYYNKEKESGINIFDTDINIDWKIDKKHVIMSNKDLNAQSFKDYSKDKKFIYKGDK